MNDIHIIYPLIALAWLTIVVLMLIPYRRIKAIKRRELTANDFSLGESDKVSDYVALANRNYMNLLELPVIFYLVCTLMYITHNVSLLAVILAWSYVALRAMHSLVHVTYNNVRHRLACFALSNFVVMGMLATLTITLCS